MKRQTIAKRICALVMTLVMIAACTLSVAALGKTASGAKYNTYLCIGDSIAAGYPYCGPDNEDRSVAQRPDITNTYPDLVRKGVGAKKIYQYAHQGYRTNDVRLILDETYSADACSGWYLPNINGSKVDVDYEGIKKLRKSFKAAIKKADLITVNLGGNDTMQPLSMANWAESNIKAAAQAEVAALLNPLTFGQETLKNVGTMMENTAYAEEMYKIALRSAVSFQQNFDAIIKIIRALNPTAKIVVLASYNPFECGITPDPLVKAVCQLFTPVSDILNNYMQYQSPWHNQYTFVDLHNIPTNMTDPNSYWYLTGDLHPTPQGHIDMANKILAAL